MYPKQHLFYGLVFSLFLFLLFPHIGLIGFLFIFLSSVLIDVDHYLYYVYKKKDFSLKKAHQNFFKMKEKFFSLSEFQRNNIHGGFYFLHGIEFLIVLFLLIFISKFFLFLFLGISFHLLLDIVEGATYMERIDKFSSVYDFFKFKKLTFIEDV